MRVYFQGNIDASLLVVLLSCRLVVFTAYRTAVLLRKYILVGFQPS